MKYAKHSVLGPVWDHYIENRFFLPIKKYTAVIVWLFHMWRTGALIFFPFNVNEIKNMNKQYKNTCENIRVFRKDGGFVFNTIHNVQSNVPVENFLAMMDAVKDNRASS